MALSLFVLALTFILMGDATDLPNYIKPCKKDDPNLNECAKQNSILAIEGIIKGDKELHLPNLNPLKLSTINFHPSEKLNLDLTNCTLRGLDRLKVEDANMDLKNRHISLKLFAPMIHLRCHYNMEGQILVIPIQGQGDAVMTFAKSTFTYAFDYQLADRGGLEYIEVANSNLNYELGPSFFHFNNLFNGEDLLGKETNKFLNENYREVNKDLGGTVSQTISFVIDNILGVFLKNYPYDKLFL